MATTTEITLFDFAPRDAGRSWADDVEDECCLPAQQPAQRATPPPLPRPSKAARAPERHGGGKEAPEEQGWEEQRSSRRGPQRSKGGRPPAESSHRTAPPQHHQHQNRPNPRAEALRGSGGAETWTSTRPKPSGDVPDLYERAVFVLGTEGYDDASLKAHIASKGLPVVDATIARNHYNRKPKPRALAIMQTREGADALITSKVVIYNELQRAPGGDAETIDFRVVEPWELRDNQDGLTIAVKGIPLDHATILSFFAALGEPRSIRIAPGSNLAFVRYWDQIAAYLAVEMFDGRTYGATPAERKTVKVELARPREER
jgi:hypothetical protein